jgi:hypothetical protein
MARWLPIGIYSLNSAERLAFIKLLGLPRWEQQATRRKCHRLRHEVESRVDRRSGVEGAPKTQFSVQADSFRHQLVKSLKHGRFSSSSPPATKEISASAVPWGRPPAAPRLESAAYVRHTHDIILKSAYRTAPHSSNSRLLRIRLAQKVREILDSAHRSAAGKFRIR